MGWVQTGAFFRQMALMSRTGMPIVNSLRLAGGTAGPGYQLKAESWALGCTAGRDLASQLAEARESPLVVALVHAGESTGRLPEMCARIADHYDQMVALRGLAVGKLVYPVCLLHMALVVPAIPAVFKDASPLWLLAGPVALWAVLIALALLGRFWHRTGMLAQIALLPGPRFLAMPFLTCNVCLVLAAAMAAGLKVQAGLELAAAACGNRVLAARLMQAGVEVGNGTLPDLTSALRTTGMPPLLCDLISNGEQAGALDVVLTQAAVASRESFQSRATWSTKVFTSCIYGAVAVYVGWLVISMYTGMVDQGMKEAGGDPYG